MKNLFILLSIMFAFQLPATTYLTPTPNFRSCVEVSALYIVNDEQILLLHRQDHKSQGNKWGIPGGKIDQNESPLHAAVREAKEETGYVFDENEVETLPTAYIEEDNKYHYTYHMFRTKLKDDPGAVKINFKEHKGFTWVTPLDALKLDLMRDEDPCIRIVYFPETMPCG